MELVRWTPRRDLFGFRHGLDRVFDDFFAPMNCDNEELSTRNWHPAVDIYDQEDNIIIKAELPGVDKKDIHVDLKGRVLTLSGERSAANEVKEDGCYRRERTFGKFQRTFNLASEVAPEKINAEYKDGVLHIEIPKPEVQKPNQIAVH